MTSSSELIAQQLAAAAINTENWSSISNTLITQKADVAYTDAQLALKANKVDLNAANAQISIKADKTYLDAQISNVANGSPKGTYSTLTALAAAYPTGTQGVFVVSADGKWYYWSGSAWTAGGTYLATPVESRMVAAEDTLSTVKGSLFGEVKLNLQTGYYNGSGVYTAINGTTVKDWYYAYVQCGSQKKYSLTHPDRSTFTVRIGFFNNGTFVSSTSPFNNGEFTVPANCNEFAINFPLTAALPTTTNTLFTDVPDVGKTVLRQIGASLTDDVSLVKTNVTAMQVVDKDLSAVTVYATTPVLGYYTSADGSFKTTGTNWYTFKVDVPTVSSRKFTLSNPSITGDQVVRILYYNGTTYAGNATVLLNVEFTVPSPYTSFALNIPTTGANPTPAATFATFASSTGFSVIGGNYVYKSVSMTERFAAVESDIQKLSTKTDSTSTDVLKILTIGNSFSNDSDEYLYAIAKSAGVEIIVGQVYASGQNLAGHWTNANAGANSGIYYKWKSGLKEDRGQTPLATIVTDEAWDIITFQQASADSGVYSTFQPYLDNLIAYVRTRATNPKMKIGLHMTWAYFSASVDTDFAKYGNNQLTMYNAITAAYQQAMSVTDIDIVIPSGTAIQNARSNTYLKAVGNELCRDADSHLDLGVGRFIAGLTFFEALIAGRYKKNILVDVTAMPTGGPSGTKFLTYLAKVAVRNAVLNPFKMTQIQ